MSPEMVHAAIVKMDPGQKLTYHTGSLMYDRKQEGPYSRMVHDTANMVYSAYERGEVTLVQHKLAPLKFEYIAIKRPSNDKGVGRKDGRNVSARRTQGSLASA